MTRRGWAFDASLAVVVIALGQLEAWAGIYATHRQGPPAAEAAGYALTGALLVLRRVRPLLCLALIVLVSALEYAIFGSPEGLGVILPGLIGAYSVARWERTRPTWWGLVLVVLLWVAWDGFDPMNDSARRHLAGLIWLSPWVIAWLVGLAVRQQAQNREQRRFARQQRDARAAAEERNRIARELHDVIGHSVSVMTVQASAVRRRLTSDQAVEREALETVERMGREALGEMRRMVGVLRKDGADPDREPPPGLDRVEDLVAEVRAAGLPVELHVRGVRRPLAGGLDLTAYRLIQEGLTNVRRHAVDPGLAEVVINYEASCLEILVRDDGAETAQRGDAGHGLLGMKERVAVYGGSLEANPLPGGGYQLSALLPLEPS